MNKTAWHDKSRDKMGREASSPASAISRTWKNLV